LKVFSWSRLYHRTINFTTTSGQITGTRRLPTSLPTGSLVARRACQIPGVPEDLGEQV